MKSRLRSAQNGHDLLQRKIETLCLYFRKLLNRLFEAKILMGEAMSEAYFSMAEAKYAMGEHFGETIIQNVGKASLRIINKRQNIAGLYAHYISVR